MYLAQNQPAPRPAPEGRHDATNPSTTGRGARGRAVGSAGSHRFAACYAELGGGRQVRGGERHDLARRCRVQPCGLFRDRVCQLRQRRGQRRAGVGGRVVGGPDVDAQDFDVAAPSTDYQAEDATIFHGTVDTDHTGFTGTGFVNYANEVGSYVEWTVSAASAGTVSTGFRYANGTTTNRPMDIRVNGTVARAGLAFPGTGSWDTWQTVTIAVALNAGANTIRATATTVNGGPNVDRLSAGVPGDIDPPTTPANPRTSNLTCNSVTFSWDASTDNVGVVAYDVFHDGQSIKSVSGSTLSTSFTVFANVTWGLYVQARDAAGNVSQASDTVEITPPPCEVDNQPPTAPTNLTGSASGTTVTLNWGAATDNVGVTAYDIFRGGTLAGTVTGNPPPTTFNDAGLIPATNYSYFVVARDAQNNVSPHSNQISVTTGQI